MSSTPGRRRVLGEAAEAAHAARRGLGPADQQRHARAHHRPRPGGALRHPARDRSTRRSTTPSASARSRSTSPRSTATTWCSRSRPSLQTDPQSLEKLYVKSPLTGQMVPLSAMTRYDTRHVTYLSINHQGQFPAVTLSFNLAPGVALGQAVDAINRVSAQMRLPATITGTFQGTAQAFQSSLKTQPYLILAALVAVYIILGMLYESYIHPLTILSTLPSAGRRRAAGAVHVPHRPVRHRADRHHPADRHREEERHHDGRLRHPGRARTASVAARCDPPGLPAALPADHDDHHGRAARRAAAGARAAAPARSCASRSATPWSAG